MKIINRSKCKRIGIMFILCGIISLFMSAKVLGYFYLGDTNTIYTNDLGHAVDTCLSDGSCISDPLRDGAHNAVYSDNGEYIVSGIVSNDNEISTHSQAFNTTLQIVKNVINWVLGILSLIALIYIIIMGLIIVTANGDEGKQKKGVKGIKNAIIAIAGIGLSWLFVSFIFWIIRGISGI